jgi:hypothetical protein
VIFSNYNKREYRINILHKQGLAEIKPDHPPILIDKTQGFNHWEFFLKIGK